jgi:integrase
VAAYLAHEAESGRAASTITRRCAAIRYAHRLADLEPPTNSESVRATLRGIRRAVGVAHERKAPVLAETARAMALSAPEGLKGLRDRALLLLGFAGAFRRSELVALDVADLEETDDGFKIVIRRSKTDQEGLGQTIAIVRGHHACPVEAVKAWLAASGICEGPLFRPVVKGGRLDARWFNAKTVCEIVPMPAELD